LRSRLGTGAVGFSLRPGRRRGGGGRSERSLSVSAVEHDPPRGGERELHVFAGPCRSATSTVASVTSREVGDSSVYERPTMSRRQERHLQVRRSAVRSPARRRSIASSRSKRTGRRATFERRQVIDVRTTDPGRPLSIARSSSRTRFFVTWKSPGSLNLRAERKPRGAPGRPGGRTSCVRSSASGPGPDETEHVSLNTGNLNTARTMIEGTAAPHRHAGPSAGRRSQAGGRDKVRPS